MADTLTVPGSTIPDSSPQINDGVITRDIGALAQPAPIGGEPASSVPNPDKIADQAVKDSLNTVVPLPTMQASMANAVGTNPDMEAEARRVAARTGVPVQTVFAEPDIMKQRAALADIDFDNFQKLYPSTALALSDEELAKVAHDDTQNMGEHEGILRGLYTNFALSWTKAYLGAKAQYGDLIGDSASTTSALNDIRTANDIERDTGPQFNSWLGRNTYGAVAGLADMAPILLSAAIDPLFAVGGFTGQSESIAYGKYRARGGTPGEALSGGLAEGGIAAATSFLPVRFLSDKIGKVGAGEFITGLLARDLPMMEAQTIADSAVDNAVANPNGSVQNFVNALPENIGSAALSALVTAGAMTGVHSGAAYLRNTPLNTAINLVNMDKARAAQGEADGAQFDNLNSVVAESKLRERDPLAFQNFIEKVASSQGTIQDVYVNPRDLAQAGVSLDKLAEVSPTIADQYRVALEIGSDMKIPVSEYSTHLAATELGQAMVPFLKTDPLGFSAAEASDYRATESDQLKEKVESVIRQANEVNDFDKSAGVVKQNVLDKLTAANRFTNDVNEQYATLHSNFYKAYASHLGTTPEELYAQHPADIQSLLDKGDTLDQGNTLDSGDSGSNPANPRGSFNPETSMITLRETANLSTFIHESGHFFLETLNKLALQPDAPEIFKKDAQSTFDWLGVKDINKWNSLDLEGQRDKHEQFARGFEAFALEGKSPSIEMRGVFRRFRDWLLRVYKDPSELNVNLSDEMRNVFGRMLATSEQIHQAELARGFEPMFKDAQTAGMNENEWRSYQEMGLSATQDAIDNLETRSLRDMKYMSNAKSRAIKDLQRQAAGRRREIRDQVTKEVMGEPVNQAREFITKGKLELPEDAPKSLRRQILEAGMGSTKLSLPDLKEMYGEKENAIWRRFSTGKNGEIGTDGLHPDIAAEMFGFSSGDELVRALLSEEKPKQKIAALTDQRMLEKYGDLTNPANLARAAEEAIHNDVRARFIATEMNALQKATGGRKILAVAAKEFAEDMISRSKVRELSPAKYAAAESRAARNADKAFAKGDLNAAAVEKRNQLIHNYAEKSTFEAQREVEKALRYFKGFDREGTRKAIDSSYLDQIDALLDRFDLRKSTTLTEIDKRKTLLEWKESQEEIGLEPNIPPELLKEAARKSYKDMTIEELRGLRDTIKQIDHLGKLKNRLLTAKDNRDFKTTVKGLVESIQRYADGKTVDNRTRAGRLAGSIRLFKGFVASHRKIASLARELDGVKDGGAMWETFIRTMNEAGNKEALMRSKATRAINEITKPLFEEGKLSGKGDYFPSIDKSMNREERLGLALNTGNKGNLQRLLDGEGWTLDQVRPVLDSLSKKEWDYVQNVWDYFETFRPEIGAKEKRVYGKEPDWIEPNPVNTKYGEYKGGYYPVKYDTRRSIAAEKYSDADLAKQQLRNAFISATTKRSFTKDRADVVKDRPLLYSMDGLYNGINEIIHDLSWHEWLIDANRLLRNRSLDSAIRNSYGTDITQQFKAAVKDIAGGEMPTGTSFEKGLADIRSGAVVAGLGLNIVNSVINLTGINNSVVRIGPKWIAIGTAKYAQNPVALTKEIISKSTEMQLRSQTMMRELNEIKNRVRGRSQAREIMTDIMFAPMRMTQMAVDIPTWYGAYQKALTEGNSDDRAIALADQAVIDAQGGGQVKDLSAIQRGGPLLKLFTTFYGYFNAGYNIGVERTKATNFKDPISVLKLGADYLMLYTVPVVLGRAIQNSLTGTQEDWKPKKLAKDLANDQISFLMSSMVGTRELTGAVQTLAGVNPYTSSYGGPAGLRFFQEFYNLATQIHQGKADEALTKSIINTAGILLHLPSTQINRTLGGAIALKTGKTHNPAAIVAGPPPKIK